jgi:peptide/nickel transport system substrate-binding protein
MDRQALNDTVVSGVGVIADSFYRSSDPLRPQLEASIPQYPFDLSRAQQLLAQAGWVRGSDGNLVHQQTGERLELEINGGDTRYIKQEQNIVADSWKKVGVQVNLFNLPAALANAMENRVERAGSGIYAGFSSGAAGTGHSKLIPGPQNRYTGGNFGGYRNPRVDTLVDQLDVTIPVDQRLPLLREHVNILMSDVAFWPMYWDVTNVMALKHVKGIATGEGPYHTWNFYEWDVAR